MTSKDIAIKVENISKIYRIGLKENMNENFGGAIFDFIKSPLRNYRKYRSLYRFDDIESDPKNNQGSDSNDIIWALRDVSFEVKPSEVLGVIGPNGAGKSTLLKILCRITKPTSGQGEIRGRVSSLLEVGTGFHPELTGRENVYLNGTILGMLKSEIDRKFDEIVDFSGIEKFIDTPVKRYSTGMGVRLAFSVAAHMEPEILLVDEVLAVGDAAFQKKCLGKMQDVAKGGRTILFVSHNFAAIENLCSKVILLREGRLIQEGRSREVIDSCLADMSAISDTRLSSRKDRKGVGEIKIVVIEFYDHKGNKIQNPLSGQKLIIRMHYKSFVDKVFKNCRVSVAVFRNEQPYMNISTELVDTRQLDLSGEGYIDFIVPELPLSQSTYDLHSFIETNKVIQDWVLTAAKMPVVDGDFYGTGRNYPSGWQGKGVLVKYSWKHSDGHSTSNFMP